MAEKDWVLFGGLEEVEISSILRRYGAENESYCRVVGSPVTETSLCRVIPAKCQGKLRLQNWPDFEEIRPQPNLRL